MPEETANAGQMTGSATSSNPFDLSKALSDPVSKAAIDAYVSEQKRSLESALNSHKEFKKQFQIGTKEDGSPIYADPEHVKKLIEEQKKGKEKAKTEPDELKSALEAARSGWEKEKFEPVRQENELLLRKVEELMIDHELQKALVDNNVHKPLIEGASLLLRRSLGIERDGEYFSVVIRGQNGETQYGANGKKTIGELVKDFANSENGKAYFVYDGSKGGGKTEPKQSGAHGAHTGAVRCKNDLKTMQAKMDWIKENGHEAFRALPLSVS